MGAGHLPLQALWLAAGLVASAATGDLHLEDSWALVQTSHVQAQQVDDAPDSTGGASRLPNLLADTSVAAHERWPSMGDIWDTVKESMQNITGQIGDITRDIDRRVEEQIYNKTVEAMALLAAKSINGALLVINKATDKLLNKTLEQKAELLQFLNNNSKEVLPLFEWALNRTLVAGMTGWKILRGVVEVSGSVLSSSFLAAGQEGLSTEFTSALERGLDKMDDFTYAMGNASRDLAGVGHHARKGLELQLRRLDNRLRMSLTHMPEFAMIFQEAFQNVLDHISDVLPLSSPKLHAQLHSVLHNVTAITWRVRSSSRELVLTCHSAVSVLARETDAELPSWEAPLQKPVERSAAFRGGGVAHGLLALGVLASLLPAFRP